MFKYVEIFVLFVYLHKTLFSNYCKSIQHYILNLVIINS